MGVGIIQKAVKWPILFVGRLKALLNTPNDIFLLIRIGFFIWALPRAMKKSDLPGFLERLRRAPRKTATDIETGVAQVARLRSPWLRLPLLGKRNTCYTRAITLFRYLEVPGELIRIHFGVEPAVTPGGHPRGHAWVSAGNKILEPPDPLVAGRVKEIYAFPEENRH